MPGQREQAIRERAYAIWKEEGRPDGKALDHWLRAEAEIISATEQQASPLEKATAFYEKNYALLNNWFLTPEIKIVLGRTVDQTCRFCGKSSPEVTFKMDAHAIPESLGNKSLFRPTSAIRAINCLEKRSRTTLVIGRNHCVRSRESGARRVFQRLQKRGLWDGESNSMTPALR